MCNLTPTPSTTTWNAKRVIPNTTPCDHSPPTISASIHSPRLQQRISDVLFGPASLEAGSVDEGEAEKRLDNMVPLSLTNVARQRYDHAVPIVPVSSGRRPSGRTIVRYSTNNNHAMHPAMHCVMGGGGISPAAIPLSGCGRRLKSSSNKHISLPQHLSKSAHRSSCMTRQHLVLHQAYPWLKRWSCQRFGDMARALLPLVHPICFDAQSGHFPVQRIASHSHAWPGPHND